MKFYRAKPQTRLSLSGCALLCIVSCASLDNDRTDAATAPSQIERTVEILEQSNREFETARESGDPEAMVRAALKRLEIPQLLVSEDARAQLAAKTLEMVQQARIAAAHNEEAQSGIDQLLAEADFGPETETGGRLFSGLVGGLKSEYIRTYALQPEHTLRLQMEVSTEDGALVFVEAPARAGVVLRVDDPSLSDACVDDSDHGSLGCRWRPLSSGVAEIAVENRSPVEVSILMITNWPITEE